MTDKFERVRGSRDAEGYLLRREQIKRSYKKKIRCDAKECKHQKGLFCQLDNPDNINPHFCLSYEEE